MPKSIREWLSEGEQLYAAAQQEYQALEQQMAEIESRMEAKREEMNEIAQVIGRKPVESNPMRAPVQIIDKGANGAPNTSRVTIARALTGR